MEFKKYPPTEKGDVVLSAVEEEALQQNCPTNEQRRIRIASYAVVAGDTVARAMERPIDREILFAIGEGLVETPVLSRQESVQFNTMFIRAAGSAERDLRNGGV